MAALVQDGDLLLEELHRALVDAGVLANFDCNSLLPVLTTIDLHNRKSLRVQKMTCGLHKAKPMQQAGSGLSSCSFEYWHSVAFIAFIAIQMHQVVCLRLCKLAGTYDGACKQVSASKSQSVALQEWADRAKGACANTAELAIG